MTRPTLTDRQLARLLRDLDDQPAKPCRCTHMDGDPEDACCAHSMRLLCCCRPAKEEAA